MTEPPSKGKGSKRHHVVSQGLQLNWADGNGRVQLVDRLTGRAAVVSTTNALLRGHFNSIRLGPGERDDQLETEWARLEGPAFTVIRQFLRSERAFDARVDQEIKVLMAMHLARSFATRLLHDRILDTIGPEYVEQMLENPKVQREWKASTGHPVSREALTQLVEELLAQHKAANDLFVPRQVSVYNQIVEAFQARPLQVIGARSPRLPFVLGDVPAMPVQGFRIGIHNGVGAVAAPEVRMALSPTVAAVLRREACAPGREIRSGDDPAMEPRHLALRPPICRGAGRRRLAAGVHGGCPRRVRGREG